MGSLDEIYSATKDNKDTATATMKRESKVPPKAPMLRPPTTLGYPLPQPMTDQKLPSDGISKVPTTTPAATATTPTTSPAIAGIYPILQTTANSSTNPVEKEIRQGINHHCKRSQQRASNPSSHRWHHSTGNPGWDSTKK
jgi:hypothetical protein